MLVNEMFLYVYKCVIDGSFKVLYNKPIINPVICWNTRLHSLGVSVEASPDSFVPIRDCQHTESKSNMESRKRGKHESSNESCSENRSGGQMPDLPKRTASQRRRAYRPSQPAPVPTGAGRSCTVVFQMPEVRAANWACNLLG